MKDEGIENCQLENLEWYRSISVEGQIAFSNAAIFLKKNAINSNSLSFGSKFVENIGKFVYFFISPKIPLKSVISECLSVNVTYPKKHLNL